MTSPAVFMPRRGWLLALLCVVLAASLALAADNGSLVGKPAPQLSGRAAFGVGLVNLTRLQNEIVYERDAQGKPVREGNRVKFHVVKNAVVLNFFATYCIPCIEEIPVYNRLAQSYADKPVKFVYVNVDTEKSANQVRDFAKKKGIEVEMMLPSVRYAVQAYKIEALPRIVVIDREGVVNHVILGFQEDLTTQLNRVLGKLLASKGTPEPPPKARRKAKRKGKKQAS